MCSGSDRPQGQTAPRAAVASGRKWVMRKQGGSGVERTKTWPMMTWLLGGTHTNSQALERNVWPHLACDRAQRGRVRVCAFGDVFSVHLPSRPWQLPLSGRETARKNKKSEKCARLRMESRFRWTWQQVRPFRSDDSVQVSLYLSVRDSGVVVVIADPTILCLSILWSAILAIDGPKWRSPPRWAFCPCWGWRWREKRLPVETQPFPMLLDRWIQCVSSPCPQVHWNMRYSSALSSLKANKSIRWWLKIRSLAQWSCLFIGTDASHIDCFHIVVAVGKVLHYCCTWPTLQSNRVPIEKLDILRIFAIGPM